MEGITWSWTIRKKSQFFLMDSVAGMSTQSHEEEAHWGAKTFEALFRLQAASSAVFSFAICFCLLYFDTPH